MLLCILRNQWTAVADNPRLSIEIANTTPPPPYFYTGSLRFTRMAKIILKKSEFRLKSENWET